MENNIDMLRGCIKNNPNLTEEIKCNIGTLTDTLVTFLPDYDYNNFGECLSTLSIRDEDISGYSSYSKEDNSIVINTKNIFEDRIDMQHLFFKELLSNGRGVSIPKEFEGFDKGLTEMILLTMNSDESMKKLNPLEFTCLSIFSKIIDPQTLINAYMNGDMGSIVVGLETFGIGEDKFKTLLYQLNEMSVEKNNNTSFVDAEVSMIEMYGKVVQSKLNEGKIGYEDLSLEFEEFSNILAFNRGDLSIAYPHHNFSYLSGFEKVKEALENEIVSKEQSVVEERIK